MTTFKKKLIETSLPLETINRETARESNLRHSKPASLHHWWSRKPHANARAVIFAQLVDDPSSRPEEFPTVAEQDVERHRLHELMEKLAVWESSSDLELLRAARIEIARSTGNERLRFLDPFAGGGILPLEAQRLGLEPSASDLNPVSVAINQAVLRVPSVFDGLPPVNPLAAASTAGWHRLQGFAEDLTAYADLLAQLVADKVGSQYPTAIAPGGTKHPVVAWIWARTVRSPNPANPIHVPLTTTWQLSSKAGREAWVEPIVENGEIDYHVRTGKASKAQLAGTRTGRGATSFVDGTPISADYIKAEGQAGRLGTHMIAVVALTERGRIYLNADDTQRLAARVERPTGAPDAELPFDPRNVWTPAYGITTFADLFTNRQLQSLTTFSSLVSSVKKRVLQDALAAGLDAGDRLEDGGQGALAYADAMALYLGLAVDKLADLNNSMARWSTSAECPLQLFSGHSIPMVWNFAEANPLGDSSGSFKTIIRGIVRAVTGVLFPPAGSTVGQVSVGDAADRDYRGFVIATDPPYYDMVGYADLADFFYVWLRRSIGESFPSTLSTILTPKATELVANPYRQGGKEGSRKHFIDGFNRVFSQIRASANPDFPLVLYYAYKQESNDASNQVGWYALLDGLISGGWTITATWPVRTERAARIVSLDKNSIASTIVLSCRPRPADAPATNRRGFAAALRADLPAALQTLMQGAIAPVDLAQAALGPGISVFSQYSRVREADGSDMSVKDALMLINATLDAVLDDQESDFDSDTRFAIKWYRQCGWDKESSGLADQLARSSDTSIGALERGGIFEAKGGKARLLSPTQLDGAWQVEADDHVSVWEATVRLAAVMAKDGAERVAELLPAVQARVNLNSVKELGFLLFREAEKKKDAKDANLFNGLVSAWSDLNEQAREFATAAPRLGTQQSFDFDDVEG